MKLYNSCGFTAVVVLFLFVEKKGDGELIVIRRLTNEQNTKFPVERQITCISDNDDAALVWNNELGKNFQSVQTTDFIPTKCNHLSASEIRTSTDCVLKWEKSQFWETVNSRDEPMMPVFDYRWESFQEFVIHENIVDQQYIHLGRVNNSFGDIVFSVRARRDVHVFICERADPEKGACFWIVIGGWDNTQSAIRSCPEGANPWNQKLKIGKCSEIPTDNQYSRDIVSLYEWRTFRINWNATEKKIEIFKGTDERPFLRGNVTRWYDVEQVSFRSTRISRFRFHFYDYIRTRRNNAVISTKQFVRKSDKFCVKLFVALCSHCSLKFRLLDTELKQPYDVGRIDGYENSTLDGLLAWRTETLSVTLENMKSVDGKLEIITDLNRDKADKGLWAIDGLRFCESDDAATARSLTLTIKQLEKAGVEPNWNELTCQKLSRHIVVRSSTPTSQDTSRLPENWKKQKELCGFPYPNLGKSWWLCNPTGCTCDRGFNGMSCEDECDNGHYGYNCAETCVACDEKSCDKKTGSCDESKRLGVQQMHSPPEIMLETPIITPVNDTTVLVSQYVNSTLYRNCQIYVSLQRSEASMAEHAEYLHPTSNSSNYQAHFFHLHPNTKYELRLQVQCFASVWLSQYSEFTFRTTCGGEHLFRIEPGDTSIEVHRRSRVECNDPYGILYQINVCEVNSKQLVDTRDVPQFPTTLSEKIVPFTKYEVSIADTNDRDNPLFKVTVCTLEAAPGKIRNLMSWPTATTVNLQWDPPEERNGILRSYNVSIKMVTLLACEKVERHTLPKDEMIPKTVENASATFENLHPYARYNVTVIAWTSKPGEPYLDTFKTFATDIPTAKFSNFSIIKKFTELTWTLPDDCTTISGPLGAARLSIKRDGDFPKVNKRTNGFNFDLQSLGLAAFAKYTVRLYALRALSQANMYNPDVYQNLSWITPAQAPPAVTNLTFFDADRESISLKWLPPVPSNGEIESYQVYFYDRFSQNRLVWSRSVSETNIMCQWGENFVCAEDIKLSPHFEHKDYLRYKVCAKNKDVENPGCTQWVYRSLSDLINAYPADPEKFSVTPSMYGIVNLQWELPKFSPTKITGFSINYQLNNTQLLEEPRLNSSYHKFGTKFLEVQDRKYELHLLPSSEYKISLFSKSQSKGSKVVTGSYWTPPAVAFADEEELQVSHSGTLIKVEFPKMVNMTKSTKLEVIVNGPITCDDHSSESFDSKQRTVMKLIVASYSAANINETQLIIGGSKPIENVGSKCHLNYGESYTIEFKIQDESVNYIKPGRINLIDGDEPEARSNLAWLIILPILVIGLVILYIWNRKRRNTVVRTSTRDDIPLSKTISTMNISSSSDTKMNSSPPYDTLEQQISTSYSAPDVVPYSSNSSHLKVEAFEEYVKECISRNLLDSQYALYPRGLTKSYEYGRLPPNVSKNRYKNLTAYDENRVVLDKLPDDPYSDYINASYIQGFRNQKAYIATQGPKPNTVIDFWRMIWQEEVRVICMLANIIENGRTKCEQYWPEVGKKLKYGEVSVLNTNHEVFADYTFRTFQLSFTGEKRKVMHLHYTGWPDHGVPTYSQSLVTYLKKLRATRVGNGPVVVHCSAGVGRTGTIILCDTCLKQAETDGVIDVPEVMTNLRAGRANMVDNEQQYLLAHLVISESMYPEKTQIPCSDNLPQELKKLKKHLHSDIQRLNDAVWQDRALHSSVLIDRPDQTNVGARNPNRHSPEENDQFNIVVVDGVKNKGQHLASKLPSSKTLGQLWKLISEQGIELVIMLQRPHNKGRVPCEVLPGEYISTPAPNIQLETITRSDDEEHFTMDKLLLTDSSDPNLETRRITVLTCNGWEPGRDGAPPPPASLVSLWIASEKIPRKAGPAVVLCHDGITGCGLYLALSFLLERMAVERECDIISAVRAVRRFKTEFVRSSEQFNYLYDAALNYHECFQTYANFS